MEKMTFRCGIHLTLSPTVFCMQVTVKKQETSLQNGADLDIVFKFSSVVKKVQSLS